MSGWDLVWLEDERLLLEECADFLRGQGYTVRGAATWPELLALLKDKKPDLVLLDWMVPGGIDGLEACKLIQRQWRIPVIMVTAKGDEFDKVLALEIGADDYLTKPFGLRELAARIKAVLRRAEGGSRFPAADEAAGEEEIIRRGELTIDPVKFEARLKDKPLDLTRTEFQLLAKLAAHPGRVFTRMQLMDEALGDAYVGYERTMDSHIRNLRRKLGDDPADPVYIHTVYGVGYKFAEGV
ncbi:response regulator transcription factor [Paenibacillus thermoaerophilus]|uniref:Response regulator transcription factor n=1 Tax=Paenibacillus thermoaerophilus TaxID=1215385 RepID=A0ABW2V4P0_9BACL|nr:response regulator transcription factor [Paenibacillus thermoaerophilus]TMV18205.1 response regulator transcription factor [Paenibacillus thermoaerophilus]